MAESKARPPAPPRPNQVRAAAKAGASVAPAAPRKPEAPKAPMPPVNAASREEAAKAVPGSSPRLISPTAAAKPLPPGKPTTVPTGKGPPPLRKAAPSVPQAAPNEPKKPLTSTAPLAPNASPAPKLTSTAPLAPAAIDAAKTASTEAPVKKPLTSTAPLAPTTPGRPMRPSAPPPLPARAASKPPAAAPTAPVAPRAVPSAPALPTVTATQSTPAGLADQTVAEGSPAYAGPLDEDMEDAPTMATAAPEFETALDEVLAARREAPPVDLGRTLAVEALRAQASRFAPAPANPAPPSHAADLADQTHTMVMPSAPPPPPASTAPKFDEALFQAPSVTPRALAAKAALPPPRPRIETADHFEPSGDQYVPDADLLWKPGEPAGDVMPAQPALLHSRSAPTVQTHAVPPPEMHAPTPRASSFGDNEFWAPPPDYRSAVPTTGANVVAPDLMDASMRGQMSQSIGVPRSRIPASYAIVGAAVLATMLCVLAIVFSR